MDWGSGQREGEAIGIGPADTASGLGTNVAIGVALLVLVIAVIVVAGNRKWRFYAKYHSFSAIYLILGLITIPLQLFNACDAKSTRWPRLLVRYVQGPLYGVGVKVSGMEHYPDGPFVLVCNHQSSLDCVGIMELWPWRCVIIMKKILKYAGPFGLGAILAGTIFVDRTKNGNVKETLKEAVEIMHRKKYRILIFPEGTRRLSSGKELSEPMLPFKKGAFNLAVLAQVPIVPAVFSSQKHMLNFKEHTFRSGEFTGTVLPPVSTEGYTLADVQELSDKVRSQMIEVFRKQEADAAKKDS